MTTNIPARTLPIIICLALALAIPYSLAAAPRASMQTHGAAQQPDIRITSVGLQYELPKGWKAENQENGNVFLTFEDGACNVTFVFDENYPEVVEGMKGALKEQLTDIKFDGVPKEDTHNSMKHVSESGTGMLKDVKGVKINWSIDVLKATKHVTILTFGVEELLQKHIDEYVKFIGSLKKTN
jgi:hypothetical protein